MAKKYFWLKLKEDFFQQRSIKKLRKIAGGDTYTIIYLKLQLLSLRDEGKLLFEGIEENFAEEMALVLDEEIENVKVTLTYLEKNNLIEIISNDEYFLPEVFNSLGSETSAAERMRQFRTREKEKQEIKCNDVTLECNSVTPQLQAVTNSYTEIDIEIDKEKDIDKDLKIDDDSFDNNITKIEQEEKESIHHYKKYINNLKKLKTLVIKATGLERLYVDNVMIPSKFRKYDIEKLISKIMESDFLQGKTKERPKISNFTSDYCLNLILADSYKNKKLKNKIKKYNDADMEKTLNEWVNKRETTAEYEDEETRKIAEEIDKRF